MRNSLGLNARLSSKKGKREDLQARKRTVDARERQNVTLHAQLLQEAATSAEDTVSTLDNQVEELRAKLSAVKEAKVKPATSAKGAVA
ncbi:hypothetical protein FA95DRAFT_1610243 [Auriscalpium vulgare]|uniref:Uncharacterized protein n=1 Tax=Auriscalpium vulgare TaxID=40419 RepID=A0ACB8RE52_9AGAM|nr:hypothetical protein FA95DRAFT_1610243 [Auriscalpium vulgare]